MKHENPEKRERHDERQYNLIVNPGSTSTKAAIYRGKQQTASVNLPVSQEELARFTSVAEQKDFRKQQIQELLKKEGINPSRLKGVIGIGGWLHPAGGGVFPVSDAVYEDLISSRYGEHVSNLGGVVARELADEAGIKAYVADPVTTDEISAVARLSGLPDVERSGKSHALNQKRAARMAAEELGKRYENARLIVSHLGGGISVVAHEGGRMTDTNSARGEGPFSMDRCGGINTWEVAKLCFSGKYSEREIFRLISGNSGVAGYLGVRDFREVVRRRQEGDKKADMVFSAMAYQIAKEIGSMAAVLCGKVDALIFTGGMAHSEEFIGEITRRTAFIAPSLVYPGENEMEALAGYLEQVQDGTLPLQSYEAEILPSQSFKKEVD